MKKPPKTHLLDREHERKIPSWDGNKILGYHATACGYQRKDVASDPSRVNCKLCLREMRKKNI
jgi:hypothetical protein